MSRAAKKAPTFEINGNALLEIDPTTYHNDPALTPSLSASVAHLLVSASPLHAFVEHPRLGGVKRERTKSMNTGDLFHALLLGAGKQLEIIDADNYKLKTTQDTRDAAFDAGKIPVLAPVHAEAASGCRIIAQRLADIGITFPPKRSEVGLFWVDHTTDGEPVQCRGLIDSWQPPLEYDLKSCRRATKEAIASAIAEHGYAIQRAAYRRGLEANVPKLAGRIAQRLIFFETAPPYDVVPVRLSALFAELGETLWQRAVDTWAECLRTESWPGVLGDTNELEVVDPPPWWLKRWEEAGAA